MNYPETLEYLYNRLPMFHRIGAAAYKANLNNINALADILNHPEIKIRSIHIAGTNGKGSVSNMIASVLQESGYKTGLFTSPHLKDFRERIRIDGEMISEKIVTNFVEEYITIFEDIKPSFFEWTTALAFNHFAKEKVDVAVIETGLGGRLDSTNIILPELSIITNISYDHMYLLGNTLPEIAKEKAGIIKEIIPVVVGERQDECSSVFIDKANESNSPITFASDIFNAEKINDGSDHPSFRIFKNGKVIFDDLTPGLSGNYQSKNIVTVLQSIEILQKSFSKINEKNIGEGLKHVIRNTGLQGRWEIIATDPLTIVDVAHNEAGIKFVAEQLNELISAASSEEDKQLHIVFGMVNDKNPSTILSLLPKNAIYYFCKADIPRALDANELKKIAVGFKLNGENYSSVSEAVGTARKNAGKNDVVFIGGSTFVVAEAIV